MAHIDQHTASLLLQEHCGLDGELHELPSEWGGTYKVTRPETNYLLKVAPLTVDMDRTMMEVAAVRHLSSRREDYVTPNLVTTNTGEFSLVTDYGIVRLYSWIEGRLFAEVNPITDGLLVSLGTALARLSRHLADFSHRAADGQFMWSPHNVLEQRQSLDAIAAVQRSVIEHVLDDFERVYPPLADQLPYQVTYNDANDHNIIVHGVTNPQVRGFIDFGDLDYGPAIGDLAVALSYIMMGSADPVRRACIVVGAFHEISPISEAELEVLGVLIRARLVISVVTAAQRAANDPENAYWQVSTAGAWQLLQQLDSASAHLVLCRFRHACGFEPSPSAEELRTFLRANRNEFHPVTGFDLTEEKVTVFDWSVGSVAMGGFDDIANVAEMTHKCFGQMALEGTRVGIGRYDEPRAVYTTAEYAVPSDNGPEMRSVHLGVDIFMPAGTPLFAPLDGVVEIIVNDQGDKEYGPLVVLKHTPPGAPAFYSLYGHNNLATLDLWNRGDVVTKGDIICYLGDFPENGNWVPHSHFQIMTDLLEYDDDFPGVALPSQRAIWLSLCPDPNLILGVDHPDVEVHLPTVANLIHQRKSLIPDNLSVVPLHFVRGWKSRLYAATGHSYLDTRNNISHVGHEHPRVVKAVQQQMAVLNTNSRYPHHERTALGRRLLQTLPAHLTRVVFVNSGSEANDLALRMARSRLGTNNTLTMWQGYHGHTQACIEVSPYKFEGPGGAGRQFFIRVLPKIESHEMASGIAVDFVKKNFSTPGTFIHECLPGCAGQIVPPEDYFVQLYHELKKNGCVCIADEVQTGMGRLGTHFWSFELYGIDPDIVTIGKPLGNGHPVAAVAMTEELAVAFDNGMEFFSSFGGNPVSCAAANAVLDVIYEEALLLHVTKMSDYWLSALQGLREGTHAIVDVRGYGYYLGVEFIDTDHENSKLAAHIQQRLLDHRILTSLDGPRANVMKLKPPLCFNRGEIDYFIQCLRKILREDVVTLVKPAL